MQTVLVQRRRSGPKTKSGCKTCKIRRIKCDEAKPACQRCTKTGRKCDGYDQEALAASGPEPQASIHRLVTHLPGNRAEKRGFQYFVTQTAPELSGFYSGQFWEHLMLQAASGEPALRHAITAIGALHEEFVDKQSVNVNHAVGSDQSFATIQYSKAMVHLRKSIEVGQSPPITALMSCILFVCFDSLRGNFGTAMLHLQSGLRILQDYRMRSGDKHEIIENYIAPTFKRLGIQAILYIDTKSTPERRLVVEELGHIIEKEIEMPEAFRTLEEARAGMNQAADGLFRAFYMCQEDLPLYSQPLELHGMMVKYRTQLCEWNSAFEKFMNARSHTLNSKELRGAAVLKIHAMTAKIMGDIIPSMSDHRSLAEVFNDYQSFEAFTEEFRIIINLLKSIIVAGEQDKKNGKPAFTFSTELGLLGPLWYASLRVQDQALRDEGLDLLSRCQRREGMWDSVRGMEMIKEFREVEIKHRALQKASIEEFGVDISICDLVDLVINDGGSFEWKWKEPFAEDSGSSNWSGSESGLSQINTPTPDPTGFWDDLRFLDLESVLKSM